MLHFELRANPVLITRSADGRARRHDVVMQQKKRLLAERGLTRWAEWATADRPALPDLVQQTCAAWLLARSGRLGVEFDDEALRAEGYVQHRGMNDELRFSTVDFSGRLCVADPTALGSALRDGIGHGKAFGCGLMMLRPVG